MPDDQQVYPFPFCFNRNEGGVTVADADRLRRRLSLDQDNIKNLLALFTEMPDQEFRSGVGEEINKLFSDALQATDVNNKEQIQAALWRIYDWRFSFASESDSLDRVYQLVGEKKFDVALHMLQQAARRNVSSGDSVCSAQIELAALELKSHFSGLGDIRDLYLQLAECRGLVNEIYSLDVKRLIKESQEKVDTYRKVVYESVGVRAVRKYWSDKSSELGLRYKLVLAAISSVVIGLLVWFVYRFGDVSAWINALHQDQSNQLVAILPVTLMAGVAIWLLRIFVKLMMSSYYLAEDASVRVVMIDTLIALLAEEKIDKNAQALLLQHVFSPPSFGDQSSGVDIPMPALLESLRK